MIGLLLKSMEELTTLQGNIRSDSATAGKTREAPHHQEIYQKYIHKKGVTPEKSVELQEGQYPEVGEQIRLRGWRRLSKPRTKISKDLVLEFYTNVVRTEEELASGEDYPYTSFVRGTEVDFSVAKIREVLRIKHMTLGAETDFKTRQYEDQRLDEVIRDICMPGAQWKMSSSQPLHLIQLRRQDLTPVARGWAEFIIHFMIPTGNKSEITVARAVLIHSIIKGHDVRVEELIADNIAVLAEGVQGKSKLCFSSTITDFARKLEYLWGNSETVIKLRWLDQSQQR
ncbi:hypothetical protein PIB30_078311 [Stylosanthes scabra]|uniref:Putative plant transposon protein domain-containing protein n=1 Tax=Stylosanthes scabra TaxID=79078 RepID=A0ABU6SSY0_9FABA|nr:hypothetical protein [Stylosanthes scabra]